MDARKKSILITGAASGIGRETALLFARRGWQVGAADVQEDALRELASDPAITALVADVRTREAAGEMVGRFMEVTDGRLDVLFNCAGLLEMGAHETIAPARIDRMLAVNIHGVVHCTDAAFPFLKRTPGAHLVNMSSASAEFGAAEHAVYSGTKFFIRGFTEALHTEFRAHDIQVSDVMVSYVQTPMISEADVKSNAVEQLGVKVRPEQVAEKVWQAAHGDGLHWRVGLDAHLLGLATRLLGSRMRHVVRFLVRG